MEKTASSALTEALAIMDALEESERHRVIKALLTFYNLESSPTAGRFRMSPSPSPDVAQLWGERELPFKEDTNLDPKEFMKQKKPTSAVERIACLAFYLAKFRDKAFFKTHDLTRLNTEAAQPKFSNASQSTANALKYGYLASGSKGNRQISAFGEEFVNALPDRDAAKEVSKQMRPPVKKKSRKRPPSQDGRSTSSVTVD